MGSGTSSTRAQRHLWTHLFKNGQDRGNGERSRQVLYYSVHGEPSSSFECPTSVVRDWGWAQVSTARCLSSFSSSSCLCLFKVSGYAYVSVNVSSFFVPLRVFSNCPLALSWQLIDILTSYLDFSLQNKTVDDSQTLWKRWRTPWLLWLRIQSSFDWWDGGMVGRCTFRCFMRRSVSYPYVRTHIFFSYCNKVLM